MVFGGDFPPSVGLLSYFKQLIDHVLARAVEENGEMTRNQIELIAILGRPLTLKEVSAAMVMHPSNVTGLVKACAKAGWVKTAPSATDKRTKFLSLTHSGIDLRKRLLCDMARYTEQLSGITEAIAARTLSELELSKAA